MKRILLCALAAAMVLAMAGCDLLSMFNKEEPTTPTAPKELELGVTEGLKYENEFIGIGYNLDDDWTFYTDEQIKELNRHVEDTADQNYLDLIKNADMIYDMMATNGANNTIMVILEKMPNAKLETMNMTQTLEASFKAFESSFKNMGLKNISHEITTLTIGGEPFYVLHMSGTIYGMTMQQSSVLFKCNGYLATFSVATFDEEGTAPLLEGLYLLK